MVDDIYKQVCLLCEGKKVCTLRGEVFTCPRCDGVGRVTDQRPLADVNERQVGGSHYRTSIQHWDFVAANELDYFQGVITKYVTRWKKKGGLEDLRKAQHYLEKYVELIESGIIPNPTSPKKSEHESEQRTTGAPEHVPGVEAGRATDAGGHVPTAGAANGVRPDEVHQPDVGRDGGHGGIGGRVAPS